MERRPLFVGIDLGTTNTVAVVFDGTSLQTVRTSDGALFRPSVVRVDARGRVSTGHDARRQMDTDPENTRGEFKRLMGSMHRITFPASGRVMSPEELSAAVLQSVRDDVAAQTGTTPRQAVISVPALFELPQVAATAEAARLAGFDRVEIIQEPVASAIASGWSMDDATAPWLVYDLGGGTFDASLLETREGVLRVIGHDGDNFLGGRDMDTALMERVLQRQIQTGTKLPASSDAAWRAQFARLRTLCEAAKITLNFRPDAAVTADDLFTMHGMPVSIDVTLDRVDLEQAAQPVIERSLEVCHRLLRNHGLRPADLRQVVLVGGPTAMPLLRDMISRAFETAIADDVDPMVIVAQGAAIFAMNSNLPATTSFETQGAATLDVWVQYPSVTSDLEPFVVGRLAPHCDCHSVRIHCPANGWYSEVSAMGPDASFVIPLRLQERRLSQFQVEGLGRMGWTVLSGGAFAISHGLSIGDPPLSRSIGVATASNDVRLFFERGAPLPARRVHSLRTVDALHPGRSETTLRVPVVQGELPYAHLCRLIGVLEISGRDVKRSVAPNAEVDITLDVDRSGRLRASALIPSTGQAFEHVISLQSPIPSASELRAEIGSFTHRLESEMRDAFAAQDRSEIQRLSGLQALLTTCRHDLERADGDDPDALERARRTIIELRNTMDEEERVARELAMRQELHRSMSILLEHVMYEGTEMECQAAQENAQAMQRALQRNDLRAARSFHEALKALVGSINLRSRDHWLWVIAICRTRLEQATDKKRAQQVLATVNEESTLEQLRSAWNQISDLYPREFTDRSRAFESGVR